MFNFTRKTFSTKHTQNICKFLNVNLLDTKLTSLPKYRYEKLFGGHKHTIIQKRKKKEKETGKKKYSQEI